LHLKNKECKGNRHNDFFHFVINLYELRVGYDTWLFTSSNNHKNPILKKNWIGSWFFKGLGGYLFLGNGSKSGERFF
jgi:hypothetical protein